MSLGIMSGINRSKLSLAYVGHALRKAQDIPRLAASANIVAGKEALFDPIAFDQSARTADLPCLGT